MSAEPVRTCIGCRRRAPQHELVRFVVTADGEVREGRTLPGRGAWLCRSPACLALAIRRRAFARAFRRPVAPEALSALQASWEADQPVT